MDMVAATGHMVITGISITTTDMKFLKRITTRSKKPEDRIFDAALAPTEILIVVGDVHGCDALLAMMLDEIAQQEKARIVFVGDYVDRGEHSAQVLTRLHALAKDKPKRTVFLRGNHEEMLLNFLDDPVRHSDRWLRYGGLQTLASYGIGGVSQTLGKVQATRIRDTLATAIGPEIAAWLRTMPTLFSSGNVAVVHAGADPNIAMDAQTDQSLVWGHPEFTKTVRDDGIWVVHGHTITDHVASVQGRIAVDTGAYATGHLSGVVIKKSAFKEVRVSI